MCDLERTERALLPLRRRADDRVQADFSLGPSLPGRGPAVGRRRHAAARAALAAAALLAAGCRRDSAAGAASGAGAADSLGWTTQVFVAPVGALAWSGKRFVTVGGGPGRWSSVDAKVWLDGEAFASFRDVAWDGHNFAAVGESASVSVSSDGLIWKSAMPSLNGPGLYGIASSGSLWVAVGSGGAILHAAASEPGDWSTWTLVAPPPTSKDLMAVTWAGGQFVAVGREGAVVSSPDGLSWTLQPAATTSDLVSIAAASATSMVASTNAIPSQLLSSADLKSWTANSAAGYVGRVAFLDGQYLALGEYASATSADGVTWKTGTAPAILGAAIFDGQRYLATSSGAVFTSTDGLVWEPLAVAGDTRSIARDPASGRMVATGGDVLQVAPDGGAWAYRYLRDSGIGAGDAFDNVIWAPALNAFGAMSVEAANQALFRSADGESWTRIGNAPCYIGLASSGTTLVNVGGSLTGPCLATSTDGTTWTPRAVPGDKQLTRAFWTGSAFVAVGPAGALATAPADGSVWTARASGVAAALNGAAGSGACLVVVGDGGTILSSDNGGETWSPRASGTSESLHGVLWTGAEFAAVGTNATLLRSADGAAWRRQATPYAPGSFSYTLHFEDVAWSPAERLLTVVGSNGFLATVP